MNTNHRKNLLEFALGEPAVAARAAADEATAEAKKASEDVQSLSSQLAGHHSGMSLAQFERSSNSDGLFARFLDDRNVSC